MRPPSISANAASIGRPSGSLTRDAALARPTSVDSSASIVPSPPSATGSSTASRPAARSPRAIAAATSRAENVPLNESGATRAGSSAKGLAERPLRLVAVDGEHDALELALVLAGGADHQARRLVEREAAHAGPERDQRQRAAAELLGAGRASSGSRAR